MSENFFKIIGQALLGNLAARRLFRVVDHSIMKIRTSSVYQVYSNQYTVPVRLERRSGSDCLLMGGFGEGLVLTVCSWAG